ncbi:hypothetical protein FOT42_016235 [Flagellimonas hadalis]|uniref:Uncharacterized protein n=1 Tax=Flagellimonas hadalis TaxID=2597517 RepID=A0A5N5IKH4_9FLAO|nr:hypothetical protein FOT42_016235 [Allomuricauda hadalis]
MEHIPWQDHAIVWNGHIFPIYGIGVEFLFGFWFVVDDELVPKQVEIYPMVTAPAFLTFKDFPIKSPALIQIVHRNGHVKRSYVLHGKFF